MGEAGFPAAVGAGAGGGRPERARVTAVEDDTLGAAGIRAGDVRSPHGRLRALAVVPLDAVAAREVRLVGAKAANLARAAGRGLPVLPGFVVVPAARAGAGAGAAAGAGAEAVRAAWRGLGGEEGQALVVRSSSAREDTAQSSMAGRFDSVLDVRGWEAFVRAVARVLDSALRIDGPGGPDRPAPPAPDGPDATGATDGTGGSGTTGTTGGTGGMAVLVQPMVESAAGGVMFGADPVEGRYDRVVVSAVAGGPDRLVDGSTQGVRYQLTRRGRLLRKEPRGPRRDDPLSRRRLVRLARLARRAERVYGGPQDMEFGFDAAGRLWLFQARPITAMAARPPRAARLLGPGPVAETLPGVLQPLEEDLWVAPMAHGLALAMDIAGAAPRRALRRLPVATTVGGRAAADLLLLGAAPPPHPALRHLNPAPGARRAAAAWRVGRLRTALPLLARDLMADVDRRLHDFAAPHRMLSGELLDAVSWGRTVLSALHAQEALAGALLDADPGSTAAAEALAVVAEGRGRGLDDAGLISRHPVVLTLLPPTLGDRPPLPGQVGWNGVPRGVGFLSVREGLRLRIRWVQEMQAAMVREAGSRMDAHCPAGERRKIALLSWRELLAVGAGGGRPADLADRTPRPGTPPLPAAFKLAGGRPQAVRWDRRGQQDGQGAGGGHGTGTAWDGAGVRPYDAVLVVRFLDPALAPLLPGLSGLVAETGSVLSHLAVLAREHGVPTVVGVPDAPGRFAPGATLAVDGGTGTVQRIGPIPGPAPGDGVNGPDGPDGPDDMNGMNGTNAPADAAAAAPDSRRAHRKGAVA